MKITCLMENAAGNGRVCAEHGLSVYVETKKRTLLIDTGASAAFIKNADAMKADLSKVEMLILSHGHNDHTGGVMAFYERNKTSSIYLQEAGTLPYFTKSAGAPQYIGVGDDVPALPTIKLCPGDFSPADDVDVFTNVTGRRLWPAGNRTLMVKRGDVFEQDDFRHEQYAVIREDGKEVLISGCAHNGILNILDAYRERYGKNPDYVISGFHTMQRKGYSPEDLALDRQIAEELTKLPTVFYTGHCTDIEPYSVMKAVMGEKLHYIHCGDIIEL